MKRVILFVAFAALCGAQTTVNGGRDYKGTLKASGSVSAVDFSGAASTAPAKAGPWRRARRPARRDTSISRPMRQRDRTYTSARLRVRPVFGRR